MTITTLGDGRFLEVNEAFEVEMGYSREEVIGHTALELGLWLDPSERSGVMAEVNDADGALTREIRFRTKAGQPMTALYSAARIDIEGQPPLLLAVCENITARKQAEATQRAMLKALPDWMFLVSNEGVFLDFHARDRRNLLSPPEVFMGRNVRDVLPPDVANGLIGLLRAGDADRRTAHVRVLVADHGRNSTTTKRVSCDATATRSSASCVTSPSGNARNKKPGGCGTSWRTRAG